MGSARLPDPRPGDLTRIRRFRPEDAGPTRAVLFAAVRIGAAEHYTPDELAEWAQSPDLPPGWGPWLDGHVTFVAETGGRVRGFMMLEASGYVNMTYVLPEYRRTGPVDRLYAALLAEAQARDLPRLTALASSLAQRFFARHLWRVAPELAEVLGEVPQNRAMMLEPLPR